MLSSGQAFGALESMVLASAFVQTSSFRLS